MPRNHPASLDSIFSLLISLCTQGLTADKTRADPHAPLDLRSIPQFIYGGGMGRDDGNPAAMVTHPGDPELWRCQVPQLANLKENLFLTKRK